VTAPFKLAASGVCRPASSRLISTNLDESRRISANLGQVQPSAAYRPRSLLPYAYERYLQASQPQLEEGATGSGSEEEEAAEAPREAVEGGAGEASTGVAATLTDVP